MSESKTPDPLHLADNGGGVSCEQALREVMELADDYADGRASRGSLETRLRRALSAASAVLPQAVEKDAARYRWLREGALGDADAMVERLIEINPDPSTADEFDATVDAAMLPPPPVAERTKPKESP